MNFVGLIEELRVALNKKVDLLRLSDLSDNVDLINDTRNVTITTWDPNIATVDRHGYLTAHSEGKTVVQINRNGKSVFTFRIEVIESATEIPTNEIIQTYCSHVYVHKELQNIEKASETSMGSYDYVEFCTYCGKELDTYSATTYAATSFELNKYEFARTFLFRI